jgi:hypothetical protein
VRWKVLAVVVVVVVVSVVIIAARHQPGLYSVRRPLFPPFPPRPPTKANGL